MIVQGDCVALMAELPEGSVDAIVTDPPYQLAFMGKAWDHAPTPFEGQMMHQQWAEQALRVLKPGGHLLAFGGTRTYHRLACAIEDAGFEIRDCLAWLYGSGFPKSLDVSKAIDKAAGAEREIVGDKLDRPGYHLNGHDGGEAFGHGLSSSTPETRLASAQITAPATPEAQQWQGWGTALKPAHEPIVLARKPLAGTVAQNVLEHGTGALNVDGCRIEGAPELRGRDDPGNLPNGNGNTHGAMERTPYEVPSGRWPANVLLDEQAAAMLDEQTGELHSQDPETRNRGRKPGWSPSGTDRPWLDKSNSNGGDSGGASRFLYVAKASSAERNAGLDGFEEQLTGVKNGSGRGFSERDPYREIRARNTHPTVKPIELMRWLVRLVTPPNGTVLDPFTGSGTTGCAAALEGFDFLGFEREAEYVKIAEARIAWWSQHPDGLEIVKALEADRERRKVADSGQLGLLS